MGTYDWIIDKNDIEAYKAEMNRRKTENPFLYWITGGDGAVNYNVKNFVASSKAETVVSNGFDIVVWLKNNWQLTIIGFIALLVLLRD